MAKMVRWVVETDETLLQAARLRAAKDGVNVSDVLADVLRKAFTAELQELSGEEPLAAMIQRVIHSRQRPLLHPVPPSVSV